MIMELTRPEQDAQIHRPHKRQWPLRRRHQKLVFPSGIHTADAQCFGTRHLKPPLVLKINELNSSPVDKFIVNRSIFGGGGGTAWKCDLHLSNFCGETGDDSAPGLKSSSFKEDISASLLLLVRIISAAVILKSVVLAEFWLMPLQLQSQSREWDSMGASHRRESEKRRNSRCIGAEPLWYKNLRLSKVRTGTDELQRKTWCSSL